MIAIMPLQSTMDFAPIFLDFAVSGNQLDVGVRNKRGIRSNVKINCATAKKRFDVCIEFRRKERRVLCYQPTLAACPLEKGQQDLLGLFSLNDRFHSNDGARAAEKFTSDLR